MRNGSRPITSSPSSSTAARVVATRPSTIGSPQPAMPSSVESLRKSQRGGTANSSSAVTRISGWDHLVRGLRLLLADAEEPHDAHADDRAGHGLDGAQQVRVALARDVQAVDEQPEQERADDRAEERADDAGPEVVGQEDGEVP